MKAAVEVKHGSLCCRGALGRKLLDLEAGAVLYQCESNPADLRRTRHGCNNFFVSIRRAGGTIRIRAPHFRLPPGAPRTLEALRPQAERFVAEERARLESEDLKRRELEIEALYRDKLNAAPRVLLCQNSACPDGLEKQLPAWARGCPRCVGPVAQGVPTSKAEELTRAREKAIAALRRKGSR